MAVKAVLLVGELFRFACYCVRVFYFGDRGLRFSVTGWWLRRDGMLIRGLRFRSEGLWWTYDVGQRALAAILSDGEVLGPPRHVTEIELK